MGQQQLLRVETTVLESCPQEPSAGASSTQYHVALPKGDSWEDEENQVVLVVSTGVVLVVSTGSLTDFLSSFDGTMKVFKSAAGEGFIVVFSPKMREQDQS